MDAIEVLSIDPGGTTGFVDSIISDEETTIHPYQKQMNTLELRKHLHEVKPDIIICEDFEIRANTPTGVRLVSVELIGVVKEYCLSCGIKLYMQKAVVGKSHFKKIARLKEYGVYIPGKDWQHSMDAMRHFMQWYTFKQGYQFNKNQKLTLVK